MNTKSSITLKKVLVIAAIVIILIKMNKCSSRHVEPVEIQLTPTETTTPTTHVTVDGSPSVTVTEPLLPLPGGSTPAEDNNVGPHPDLIGLKFVSKGLTGPNHLFTEDGKERYWYTLDGTTDMGFMLVKGLKGMIIMCEGPVIYEITTYDGRAYTNLRVKKTAEIGDTAHYWDKKTKTWCEEAQPFSLPKVKNVYSIRVLKDPNDDSPIFVEIGITEKE